jgi:hypothetical protein
MLQLKGVLHFTISVTDSKGSERFYMEVLGVIPIGRTPKGAPS